MKKYAQELLDKLANDEYVIEEGNIKKIIKEIPDVKDGTLDPREEKLFNFDFVEPVLPKNVPLLEIAKFIRKGMGFSNLNINESTIYTKYEDISIEGRKVTIWRYYPRQIEDETNKTAIIFVHGGGWMGGTPYVVENFCRYLAEVTNGVVFNVDYSLAPENPFPCGLHDVVGVIKHVFSNCQSYGLDVDNISIAGDSAGANLCFGAAHLLKEETNINIKNMFLLYIGGSICADVPAPYGYNSEETYYNIPVGQEKLYKCINMGKAKDYDKNLFARMYISKENATNPLVYPLYLKDFSKLPRAIFICPEYDGLRSQAEFLIKKISEVQKNVLYIVYKGMTHAFIDRIGYVPQAEDCAKMIAKVLEGLL